LKAGVVSDVDDRASLPTPLVQQACDPRFGLRMVSRTVCGVIIGIYSLLHIDNDKRSRIKFRHSENLSSEKIGGPL
jgi:hypothetical protein